MKNGFIKPFLLTVIASTKPFKDLAKSSWMRRFFGTFLREFELLLRARIKAGG